MGTQPSNAAKDAIVTPNYLTQHYFGVIQNAKNVLYILQSALTQLTPITHQLLSTLKHQTKT